MVGAFTPDVLRRLPRDSDWLLVVQCVLEAAVAVADREVTEAARRLLEPYAGRSVVNAGAVMWHGVTDDALSAASAYLGDPEAATRHRAAALATYERVGAGWWSARLRAREPVVDRPAAASPQVHLHEQPGGLWLVGREGGTVLLPPMRGLAHLRTLLSRPDTDVPAVHLAGVDTGQRGLEVLDATSRRVLASRLAELDAELDADVTGSSRAQLLEERGAIADYLAGATGLGGRDRTTGSQAERARVAVRKAVVAAMARIAEADPWLGRHLRDRIRTGADCRYETDPDRPVHWILRAD